MVKTVVLVSGGGVSLQAIIDAKMFGEVPGCDLIAVISTREDAYALKRAEMAGIPAYVIERELFPSEVVFGYAVLDKLRDLDAELVVLAGYNAEITPQILKRFAGRIIDSYPSLMPAFTSEDIPLAEVCRTAMREGVKITGATAYFITEKPRHGPIIIQKAVAVREGEPVSALQRRVLEEGENHVLPRALALFCEGRLTTENGVVHVDESPASSVNEKASR